MFSVQRITKETFKLAYNHHSYNSIDIKKCLHMTRNLKSTEQFQKYSKTLMYTIAYCLLQEYLTTLRNKYLKNKFNIYGTIVREISQWVNHLLCKHSNGNLESYKLQYVHEYDIRPIIPKFLK